MNGYSDWERRGFVECRMREMQPWIWFSRNMAIERDQENPWRTSGKITFPEDHPSALRAIRLASLALRLGNEFPVRSSSSCDIERNLLIAFSYGPTVSFSPDGQGFAIQDGGHRAWTAWSNGIPVPAIDQTLGDLESELAGKPVLLDAGPHSLLRRAADARAELQWWQSSSPSPEDRWHNRHHIARLAAAIARAEGSD